MLSVIVVKSHLVNVFNNNRPDSKQTLIRPVHIKSQLSYAAITEKFCIRKLYNLWKSSKKARLKKSTRKCEWFQDHGKIVLKVHKIVPRGGVFVYFLPRGRNFAKLFCPGAGNLTTWKKFPGGQPGGGGGDVGAWNWLMHKGHIAVLKQFWSIYETLDCWL